MVPTLDFPTPVAMSVATEAAARNLVRLALAEDLGDVGDLTCQALIPPNAIGRVTIRARQSGVLAGACVGPMVFETVGVSVNWQSLVLDGETLAPGAKIAILEGPLSALLTGERTVLNFMTHLSGIATLTRKFVDAAAGTKCQILDTRKTIPGYRLLAKYAVQAGGGTNHRMGLYDGILIKDNHLAAWGADRSQTDRSVSAAIRHARTAVQPSRSIEVEVDTLDQLRDALTATPEIVLLDNMTITQLEEAVCLRNQIAPEVLLEASGGVNLTTIAGIAATGVDRVSIGALTHSAINLDIGFDWE